jgi:MarR-like DNA-binding transcriptional regulator SgrR of sgrS sRNA
MSSALRAVSAGQMSSLQRVFSRILVAGVLLIVAEAARPGYGGVLRIETQAAVQSLDPAAVAADDAERSLRVRLTPLVFEPLVGLDADGGLRPLLATSWEHDQRAARWRFRLRSSVRLHDGSTLIAPQAAAVLAARERAWRVGSNADTVVIETDRPHPDLPWELADTRFAIAVRTAGGELQGSGPFRLDRLEPRRLMLRAFEDHWAGRPFVDAVQIEEGRPLADQLSAIELGRADFVAVRPIDLRRIAQRGLRTARSLPLDVFAIVFEPHRSSPIDEPVRTTLAAMIDRATLAGVVLQRQGEPASSVLPEWLTGYASSFVAGTRAPLSRAAVALLAPERRTFVLRVDAADAVAQEIAARVSVNAREAGVTVTVQSPAGLAPRPDARLLRVKLEATTPDRALLGALAALGPRLTALAGAVPAPGSGPPLESVLSTEGALLERSVIVPLVHVREVYALGDRVESWNGPVVLGSGAWNLANVWVRPEPAAKPGRP